MAGQVWLMAAAQPFPELAKVRVTMSEKVLQGVTPWNWRMGAEEARDLNIIIGIILITFVFFSIIFCLNAIIIIICFLCAIVMNIIIIIIIIILILSVIIILSSLVINIIITFIIIRSVFKERRMVVYPMTMCGYLMRSQAASMPP